MHFRLLTWLASSLLLPIFAAITGMVWHDNEHELHVQLDQDASRLHTAFDVAVGNLEQQMPILASLLTAYPEVQRLFDQGRTALAAEGGERAAHLRVDHAPVLGAIQRSQLGGDRGWRADVATHC